MYNRACYKNNDLANFLTLHINNRNMSNSSSTPKKAFSVIVVGGGIGGLTAAVALKQLGQNVTVIEQRAKYLDATGGVRQGLNQTMNAKLCLYSLGLEKAFHECADSGNETKVKRYSDGEVISAIHKKQSFSMIHRTDLLRILYQRAVEVGVEFITDQTFSSIEDTTDSVKVHLQDGKTLTADLLIGADGVHSKVRTQIPSTSQARPSLTGSAVFLIDVPKTVMLKHPTTASVYTSGLEPIHFTVGPQRCIVSWTISNRELYHLQMCDFAYNDGSAYGLSSPDEGPFVRGFTEMDGFSSRWADFSEDIKTILDETEVCTRWLIAETPLSMPWSSESGRVVLIGDAAHTFAPFAGQGAAMAIEDATVLSHLLARATNVKAATRAYGELRRPRVEIIRQIVNANIEIFGMPDGEKQKQRDEGIGKEGFGSEGGVYKGEKKWSTEQGYVFMEEYDAVREAEGYQFP